jgi:hypothetical protein
LRCQIFQPQQRLSAEKPLSEFSRLKHSHKNKKGYEIIGLLLMAYPFHYLGQYYFFAYTTSANIILATVAAYMLMSKRPRDWLGNKHPQLGRLVHAVSVNTLPIFFIHVIVLETLNKGLLGSK